MNDSNQLVVFTLDDQRYALHLSIVERIMRAVEVTCLPKSPDIVLGVINMQGQIIPVINIRRRFRLPDRELGLSDHMIVAHTKKLTVALIVDTVGGVVELEDQSVVVREKILPHMEYVEGVAKLKEGMILIHDLSTFLSLDEESALEKVL